MTTGGEIQADMDNVAVLADERGDGLVSGVWVAIICYAKTSGRETRDCACQFRVNQSLCFETIHHGPLEGHAGFV